MSIDTNITDQCLSIPNTSGKYWTSTGLVMASTSDPGVAIVGNNTTNLTVTCAQGETCPTQIDDGPTRAVFELYLSPAAMNFSLTDSKASGTLPDSMHPINQIINNGTINAGQTLITPIPWVSQSGDPTKPNYVDPNNAAANHKCLIARCYTQPDLQVDEQDNALVTHTMQAPYDPHYAQQNLTIQPAGTGMMIIRLLNGNPTRELQYLHVEARPDLNPTPGFLNLITPALQSIKGFKQISPKPLKSVRLNLEPLAQHHGGGLIHAIEEIIEEEVRALFRLLEEAFGKAVPHGGGTFGRVKVQGNVFANFEVIVDPSEMEKGNAYILDVTQVNGANLGFGGHSLVLVAN